MKNYASMDARAKELTAKLENGIQQIFEILEDLPDSQTDNNLAQQSALARLNELHWWVECAIEDDWNERYEREQTKLPGCK